MNSSIPPPPPPMMPGFGGKLKLYYHKSISHFQISAPPQLPQYLSKKQKYSVTEPVKKVQWSKVSIRSQLFFLIKHLIFQINPHTIKKDSMWVNVDEDKYVNDTLFSDIRKNFASKTVPSISFIILFC